MDGGGCCYHGDLFLGSSSNTGQCRSEKVMKKGLRATISREDGCFVQTGIHLPYHQSTSTNT